MNRLSVVIVNYNFGAFLLEGLRTLQKLGNEVSLDIWIVDNASSDDSLKKAKKILPKAHFIENKKNLGFGAANNQALRQVKGELILMLNPDIKISQGVLSFMTDFILSDLTIGAATCKAVLPDGSIDWAYHRGLPTPWASLLYFLGNDRLYHLTDRDMTKSHEVDAISGSFFLTRRSTLDKVGLFDEDYWMYAEDIDLCFRMKQAGYKIMYVPQVSITHLKGVSSGLKSHSREISKATKESRIRALSAFYETMKIFYHKHLEDRYPFFINWLVYLGIDIKKILALRKMEV